MGVKKPVHSPWCQSPDPYHDGICPASSGAPAHTSTKDKQVGGDHYKGRKLQPWDLWEEFELDPWEANAVKYLLRWKDKNGVEDLRKAIHYIEYLIEREENGKA